MFKWWMKNELLLSGMAPYEGVFNVLNTCTPYEGVFNVVSTPYEGVFTVFTNVSTVFTYESSIMGSAACRNEGHCPPPNFRWGGGNNGSPPPNFRSL